MELRPDELDVAAAHSILMGAVQPRPIAWVSTTDAAGMPNLAPFSFFMAVCARPFTVAFAPGVRSSDGVKKDTLRNLEATGECVVNVVSAHLAGRMNLTSAEVAHGVNEFAVSGLHAEPSIDVRPPRVHESMVNLEARVRDLLPIGSGKGSGTLVVLDVVRIHIDPAVYRDGRIMTDALDPIGRLAGASYIRGSRTRNWQVTSRASYSSCCCRRHGFERRSRRRRTRSSQHFASQAGCSTMPCAKMRSILPHSSPTRRNMTCRASRKPFASSLVPCCATICRCGPGNARSSLGS